MDVLTQLEQACAHGCVLLSESFAVALRPSDPALVGDGLALRRASGAAAATFPDAPVSDGFEDDDVGIRDAIHDPLSSDAASFTPALPPPSMRSSLRLSLSTAATPLSHGAGAPAVTVRRLGLHGEAPSFSPSAPSAPPPGAVPGDVGAAANAALRSASASLCVLA